MSGRVGARSRALVLAVLSLACVAEASGNGPVAAPAGVVVERLVTGGAAERAGLRPGDILLRWSRAAQPPANPEPAHGALESPFDIEAVEIEQAPRGPLTLEGLRQGARLSLAVPAGEWLVTPRPGLDAPALESYERGRERVAAGALAEGTAVWLDLAESRLSDTRLAVWLLSRCLGAWTDAAEWPVEGRFDALVARVSLSGSPRLLAALEGERARAARRRMRWAEAEAAFIRQHEQLNRLGADSLAVAHSLAQRADVLRAQEDAAGELELLQRVLELRAEAAPESLPLADAQRLLARHWTRRDQAQAEVFAEQSLSLCDRLAPESLTCARVSAAASQAFELSADFDRMEELQRRAERIFERLLPGSEEHVRVLRQLAIGAWRVHDLGLAERLMTRAQELTDAGRLGLEVRALVSGTRGVVAKALGRREEALRLQLDTLETLEHVEPRGLPLVSVLLNISAAELEAGQLPEAGAHTERALALVETLDVRARAYLAWALRATSFVALARGETDKARAACERALPIDQDTVPGGLEEAGDHRCLGFAARAAGDLAGAATHYARSLATLELVRVNFTADADRGAGTIATALAETQAEAIETLVEAGREGEAFAVLEARGRAILAQLADGPAPAEAPPPSELLQQRDEAGSAYAAARARLVQLPADTPRQQAAARRLELIELRRRFMELSEQARRATHRPAPKPQQTLDAAGVRQALDAGTLMLGYSVGEKQTLLFALGSDVDSQGLQVFRIPIEREDLRRRVGALRALLSHRLEGTSRRELETQAGELYDTLLRPASKAVRSARRLLVVPDDALLALPFAALRTDGRFLAELKPVHTALSATVHARLRERRLSPSAGVSGGVAVFGDPRYASAESALRGRPAARRSLESLGRLPGALREAQEVARLFGSRATLYAGAEASEGRARRLGHDTSIVHFAGHAYVDDQAPMSSALILTAGPASEAPDPARDGLLEAWEIAELRLNADLVTLSGCETAWGVPLAGEGLFGLTRAFLRAGAHTVLGSLWQVSDESTQALMSRFYRELQHGRTKDEALRRAQVSLVHGRWRDPFFWAAFQLHGDWR